MKAYRPSAVDYAIAAWEEECWGSLSRSDREEIRRLYATGKYSQKELARRFKVAVATIRRALKER